MKLPLNTRLGNRQLSKRFGVQDSVQEELIIQMVLILNVTQCCHGSSLAKLSLVSGFVNFMVPSSGTIVRRAYELRYKSSIITYIGYVGVRKRGVDRTLHCPTEIETAVLLPPPYLSYLGFLRSSEGSTMRAGSYAASNIPYLHATNESPEENFHAVLSFRQTKTLSSMKRYQHFRDSWILWCSMIPELFSSDGLQPSLKYQLDFTC